MLEVDKSRILAVAAGFGPLLSNPAAVPEPVVIHYLLDVPLQGGSPSDGAVAE